VTARRRLRRAVALSFPVAWALHDLEELLTAAAWGRTAPERIRRRFPNAPDWLLERLAVTTPQMAVAIGVVGAGVVTGARSGLRDLDGDMGALPAVLAAYTAHGATHLMQAAALRGYTPGVVTVPLVIAPYSVWAWRTLRRAGLRVDGARLRRDLAVGAPLAVGLALAGHATGALAERLRHR
jgi:hypothetical protein